jgi:hypothetical protein
LQIIEKLKALQYEVKLQAQGKLDGLSNVVDYGSPHDEYTDVLD